MKFKQTFFAAAIFVMAIIATGCSSVKDTIQHVPYFQNADSISYAASRGLFDAKIMPKDILSVNVFSSDPAASAPFNLSRQTSKTGSNTNTTNDKLTTFLVDNEGTINFPILGRLKVAGLTKRQCEDMIQERLKPYMAVGENPIVTVRMESFKVCIIGEVGGSRVINVDQEKISIVEALAQAGDLGLYGKRENIMLIREDASGQKSVHRLNLNDANIINSEFYYLQQNDIIYVEPSSLKTTTSVLGTTTSFAFSIVSMGLTLTTLIISLLK